MDFVQEKLKSIRTKLDKYEVLQKAEDMTKVPKEILFVAVLLIISLVFIFGMGIAPLTSIIGFFYPAYKSFQTIEQKSKNDDTQWLVYWIAFLLWAMLPQTRGAKLLYDSFLRDFLKKNESRIDAAFADAKKSAGAVASDFAAAGSNVTESKKAT